MAASALALAACGTKPARVDVHTGPSAAVRAACPRPQALADASFGATTEALTRLALTYRQCRASIGFRDDPAILSPEEPRAAADL